jgi:hypothetical protein
MFKALPKPLIARVAKITGRRGLRWDWKQSPVFANSNIEGLR